MDEREVELLEGGVRRSLRSLDDVGVPPLASVHSRSTGSRARRISGALVVSALVVVLALVAGDRLAAWRTERAASTPATATVPAPLSQIAPDARYGLLVRKSGKTTSVSFVDEIGHELIPSIDNLELAKTSPNGRYIALWLSSGSGFELRVLDGVTKTVGQPLFTTTERFARQSLEMIWASDNGAILVATTADPVTNATEPINANLRAIDLAGNVRLVTTYRTFAFAPLAWDRSKALIVARSVPQQSGSDDVLLRISEDGTSRTETPISDDPVIANDAGTYIASWVRCEAQHPCRRYAIHDAATYATVAQVDLPDFLGGSSMMGISFRPRSNDVLVNFSRSLTSSEGQFALVLYPDAARGKPHDFGTYSVKALSQPDPSAQPATPTPNAIIRADGSAAFFTHSTTVGTTDADQEGWLVELTYGSGTGVKTRHPIASVLLDPSLVLGPPTTSPTSAVATSATRDQAIALVRSLTNEVLRVDRIEAKLVPWNEFEPVGMGVDRTGAKAGQGEFPPQSVWAVAVAGDAYPNMGDRVPRVHYPWALYGINARLLQVASLKVGDGTAWPPGFDALADHPAQLVQPSPSPTLVRFENLNAGSNALRYPIRDIAATDPTAQHLFAVVSTGNLQSPPTPSTPPTSALMRSDDRGANWTAVAGVTRWPTGIAALGSRIVVSDAGPDTAVDGVTTSGGLFLSSDAGSSWKRVSSEGMMRVAALTYGGHSVFLAERWWPTRGAATGPSHIFASLDGETWRDLGQVPGPVTSFGVLDVPLVAYSKNVPGDGVYRVEGNDLASLRLVSIPNSPHADGTLTTGPSGDLWSFFPNGTNEPRRSLDGGKTWAPATTGLSGRIAGLFVWDGSLYALGDGAYRWDRSSWQVASILGPKATAVFQVGEVVFIQQGADPPWRSPAP